MRDNTRTPLDRGPKGADERVRTVESARFVVEETNVHIGASPGALPGRRPAHTAGVFLEGRFTPSEQANVFTSPIFRPGAEQCVIARLSPLKTVSDKGRFDLHGLSLRIHPSDGDADATDLVAINTQPFMFRTADEFATVMRRLRSNRARDKISGVIEFAAASLSGDASLLGLMNALDAATLGWRTLSGRSYFGIHTFFACRDQDSESVRVPYRYRLTIHKEGNNKSSGGGVLRKYRNLVDLVNDGTPVNIDLHFMLPWRWEELTDWANVPEQIRLDLINPQAVWKNSVKLHMGTIALDFVLDGEAAWGRPTDKHLDALLFDPTRLTEGLYISEDPMLIALSSIYAESHMRRT